MEKIEKEFERLEFEIDELLSLLSQKSDLEQRVEHLMVLSTESNADMDDLRINA